MTEITDEQREAVEWLRTFVKGGDLLPSATYALAIFDALPSELTNPQPALPAEPGRYEDGDGDAGWKLHDDGTWHYSGGRSIALVEVAEHAPFTRLVPERPQIAREQLDEAYMNADYGNGMNAIFDLVNGTDQ